MDKLKDAAGADVLARERAFIEEVSGDYPGNMSAFEKAVRRAAMSAIKAEARKNGMQYMKEEGLRLVVKGLTSIQELNENVK